MCLGMSWSWDTDAASPIGASAGINGPQGFTSAHRDQAGAKAGSLHWVIRWDGEASIVGWMVMTGRCRSGSLEMHAD